MKISLYNHSRKILPWRYRLRSYNEDMDVDIYTISHTRFGLRFISHKNYFKYLMLYNRSIKLYGLCDESEWSANRFKILNLKMKKGENYDWVNEGIF